MDDNLLYEKIGRLHVRVEELETNNRRLLESLRTFGATEPGRSPTVDEMPKTVAKRRGRPPASSSADEAAMQLEDSKSANGVPEPAK